MTARTRTRRLAFAAAATLAATVWAAVHDDDAPAEPGTASARPARRPLATTSTARASAPAPWPELPGADARSTWREAPPQGLAAWGPPLPPPPSPNPPAPPAAPAAPSPPEFPYTLIGRLDDGEPQALLSGRTCSFGAKAADVIDGDWRVDAVAPDGVTLTWLPGGVSRTLSFPSS